VVIPCQYAKVSALDNKLILAQASDQSHLYVVGFSGHVELIQQLDQVNLSKIETGVFLQRIGKQLRLYKITFEDASSRFLLINLNAKSALTFDQHDSNRRLVFDRYESLMLFTATNSPYLVSSNLTTIYQKEAVQTIQIGDNQTYLIKRNDRFYFISTKGEKITHEYDSGTHVFKNGTAIVVVNSKKGMIDRNGLEFIPPAFDTIKREENYFIVTASSKQFEVRKDGNCFSDNKADYDAIIKKYHAASKK